MLKLIEYKNLLAQDDMYYIETTNKKTGWIGVASFYTNGEDKIGVCEGDPSGSDDAGYTFDEFIEKYDFVLRRENEDF